MGTWGTGIFENDAAHDFMADVEDSDAPKQTITDAFDLAIDTSYLDADDGCAVVVAAAYVDAEISNTRFSPPDDEGRYAVDAFKQRHPNISLADLKDKAVAALQKVLSSSSELKELWEEGEEATEWQANVEALLARLDG